jgi:hypothetical protein
MHHRYERVISATPEQLARLLSDFDAIWPTQLAPAPRPLGGGRYKASPMIWEELERPGVIRAFRVIFPEELRGQHWFEVQAVDGGTLVRHTVDVEAFGEYEAIWRDRIEPLHGRILEALFDNIEAAVARELGSA